MMWLKILAAIAAIAAILTIAALAATLTPEILAAIATILVSVGSIYLTKKKEREAIWRAKKLAYYEELVAAVSGMVGSDVPFDAKIRFADSINKVHLIATSQVLIALREFVDHIEKPAPNSSQERQYELWSKLLWEIRSDLGDPPTKRIDDFKTRLWGPGTGKTPSAD